MRIGRFVQVIISICAIINMAGIGNTYASVNNPGAVIVNGQAISFAGELIDRDGVIMAPLREAADSVAAATYWNFDRSIVVTDGTTTLDLMVGADTAYLNSAPSAMQSPVEIINSKAFIPLRTIYELFGYDFKRDAATGMIRIEKNKNTDPAPILINSLETASSVGNTSVTIGAVGDCTLGNDDAFNYNTFTQYADSKPAGYFFGGVEDVLDMADINLANLEGALTESGSKVDKSSQGNQAFFFKGSPDYTKILQAGGITAVTIANNHSDDYGAIGRQETIDNLKSDGIGVFGYNQRFITTAKGVTVGCLGYNDIGPIEIAPDINVEKWEIKNDIKYMRSRGCQLVIAYFHWGTERSYSITGRQQDLGHFTIDNGADLVLGAHPHVVEPIEQYKGKYIVYSLGNFCFGGNNNPDDKDTFIFNESFNFNNGQLTYSSVKIIPCSISSTDSFNDYRPVVLSGSDAQRVLNKAPIIGAD